MIVEKMLQSAGSKSWLVCSPSGRFAVLQAAERHNRSSLWRDLYQRCGAVEADDMNGEIVWLRRQYNLPTSYNSLLLRLITDLATVRHLPGSYTIQQLRACVDAAVGTGSWIS